MIFTTPNPFVTRPNLQGTFGMVATTHWIATACGQAVLERGGNAFDAAVAAGFVLHVVEPHLNGPGGDMIAIFSTAADARPQTLMGRGPAPGGATIEHYLGEGLEMVPGSGALAAAMPGAFDAWLLLLRDHGTWELSDVFSFALDYARNGHPVLARVCATIGAVEELFTSSWPSSAAVWMPGGRPPREGELITHPAHAEVFERLLAVGTTEPGAVTREDRIDAARPEWRDGFVAKAAASFLRIPHQHSSGTDHSGVITRDDFAAFTASYESATTLEFRGFTIAKTGPWGQGPVLLQALSILDGFDDEYLDPSTSLGAHTIVEAVKLAMADREAYYGDRDVPLDILLSSDYAAQRHKLIAQDASLEFRPGSIPGYTAFVPPLRSEYDAGGRVDVGEPTVSSNRETQGDTCHLDVVDRWGNMISATPSGWWLQSSPAIPELGFCLGSRLQMTWLEAGGHLL